MLIFFSIFSSLNHIVNINIKSICTRGYQGKIVKGIIISKKKRVKRTLFLLL